MMTPYLEATGNTVAYNQVNLVARVEGYVQSIGYKDGAQGWRAVFPHRTGVLRGEASGGAGGTKNSADAKDGRNE